MVLEATILCLDNSEFMRNGDFLPNRLEAQRDAANLILGTKLRDNPESTVGLLTMATKIDVLSTLTREKGNLVNCLHNIRPGGDCDFVSGIQVAQLILKHRQSKNHRQRIIVFVGSPVQATEKQLVTLAKKLKKSNVSVDIVSFGEEDQNQTKLEAFVNNVNKEDNSHLVVVPSGSGSRLSDSIMSSPMMVDESAPQTTGGAFGDMDLENDPELAMALRISLEEERQRQQRQQQEGGEQPEGEEAPVQPPTEPVQQQQQPAPQADQGVPNFEAMTEEEMLQYAMQMSLQEQPQSSDEVSAPTETASTAMDTSTDEAQQAKKSKVEEPAKDEVAEQEGNIFQDMDYLTSVLGDLPGVDPSDEQVQQMLASLAQQKETEKKEEAEKEKEK